MYLSILPILCEWCLLSALYIVVATFTHQRVCFRTETRHSHFGPPTQKTIQWPCVCVCVCLIWPTTCLCVLSGSNLHLCIWVCVCMRPKIFDSTGFPSCCLLDIFAPTLVCMLTVGSFVHHKFDKIYAICSDIFYQLTKHFLHVISATHVQLGICFVWIEFLCF
jgi:hypothetical protein